MRNLIEITPKDLKIYKDKIEYWRQAREYLLGPDSEYGEEDLALFDNLDPDFLGKELSDEEICRKAKAVYEFVPECLPGDIIRFASMIDFVNRKAEGKFGYNPTTVKKIKAYMNELKKLLFEPPKKKNRTYIKDLDAALENIDSKD